jgi:hypothetical protein
MKLVCAPYPDRPQTLGGNRRRDQRINLSVPVEISQCRNTIPCHTMDVSLRGMRLHCSEPLLLHRLVRLNLHMSVLGFEDVSLFGVVVRVVGEDPCIVGIELHVNGTKELAKWERVIARYCAAFPVSTPSIIASTADA